MGFTQMSMSKIATPTTQNPIQNSIKTRFSKIEKFAQKSKNVAEKSIPELLKIGPGGSKIESGALQDAIFQDI